MCKVLVINPGSTSTKIALYEEENRIFQRTVDHPMEEINRYETVMDQLQMREDCVSRVLEEEAVDLNSLSAVVGRGGLLPHITAGGYLVNQVMIDTYMEGKASPMRPTWAASLPMIWPSPWGFRHTSMMRSHPMRWSLLRR